ncbi:MAG: hypothetical protein ABIK07_26925 [Planctomycetota bacterium]
MKVSLVLASLGLLLFGSAFAEQKKLVGKEVSSQDASRVIGGACGTKFKSGTVNCAAGTVLCSGVAESCSTISFTSLVPDEGTGEEPSANSIKDCKVCTSSFCSKATTVLQTKAATCDGG